MRSPKDLLEYWDNPGEPHESPDAGLINGTWLVGHPPKAVLQWVNPIFAPEIQLDIDLFCRRLEKQGLQTPRLIPTTSEQLWIPDPDGGSWRMMTFIPGTTHHQFRDPAMAHAAGRLVGSFMPLSMGGILEDTRLSAKSMTPPVGLKNCKPHWRNTLHIRFVPKSNPSH